MRKPAIYVCSFETTGHLSGIRLTYHAVKEAVLAAGRFSVFEASETPTRARFFTQLARDPELELTTVGYPWTTVRRKPTRP